jgi:N6-adenosine-specific RNA methylase IME4
VLAEPEASKVGVFAGRVLVILHLLSRKQSRGPIIKETTQMLDKLPPKPELPCRAIADIIVGKRHRKDMGDIDGLAANIGEVGLLQPISVTSDGRLIGGRRRIEAFKVVGRTDIPVHVVDIDAVVRGEFAENAHRKDFTPSELVAIGREVERVERDRAKERKAHDGRPGKLPERQTGDARDKVAMRLGVSGRHYEKAKAIVDAAEAEPEKFGKLLADMDRTGRVNGVFKRLKVTQQAEQIRAEPPPLPGRGPYRVGVTDPPWPYEIRDEDPSHRGVRPYPSMSIEQICALDVAALMAKDAVFFLWVPNFHLVQGVATTVLRAWDFEPKTILTWVKDRFGNGDWLRSQTEHAVMAIRGKPIVTLTNQSTVIHAPVRGHSVKPPEFYALVESLCPAPRYADLFSRYRHNDKWDCHGDQAPAADDGDEARTVDPEMTDIDEAAE